MGCGPEGVAKVVHRMNGWVDCWIIGSMEVDTINPFIHQSINPDRSAPCLESLIAQRHHWIDIGRAASGKETGQQCDEEKKNANRRQQEWIVRGQVEKLADEHPVGRERKRKTDGQA